MNCRAWNTHVSRVHASLGGARVDCVPLGAGTYLAVRVIPANSRTLEKYTAVAASMWQLVARCQNIEIGLAAVYFYKPEAQQRGSLRYYRGFGSGLGFGTPVVSYAPRAIFIVTISLSIMEALDWSMMMC